LKSAIERKSFNEKTSICIIFSDGGSIKLFIFFFENLLDAVALLPVTEM